jgi:uncharacterized membrane protein YuzA (DUF378 family)
MEFGTFEYYFHLFAQLLTYLSALNWGAIGFFGVNSLENIFGGNVNLVYCLIGLAGAFLIWYRFIPTLKY